MGQNITSELNIVSIRSPCADKEAWQTHLPVWYVRHFLKQQPRRGDWLIQFGFDARSPVTGFILALSASTFLLAGLLGSRFPVTVGTCLLLFYLSCLRIAVQAMRTDPILAGVIRSSRPHPWASLVSIASVLLPDGRAFEVKVETRLVARLLERDGQCEVLFKASGSDSPAAGGLVLGVREVRLPPAKRPAGPGGPTSGLADSGDGIIEGPLPTDGRGGTSSRQIQAEQ